MTNPGRAVAILLGSAMVIMLSLNSIGFAKTTKQEQLVCDKKDNIVKVFEDNKFFPLLNMTNKEKVVETIWISGAAIAITAANGDTVCMLAMMDDVVYNSDTITGLYKVFEAQLNKEKGI